MRSSGTSRTPRRSGPADDYYRNPERVAAGNRRDGLDPARMFHDWCPIPREVKTVVQHQVVEFVRPGALPLIKHLQDFDTVASPIQHTFVRLPMSRYAYRVAGIWEDEHYAYDAETNTIFRTGRPQDEAHKFNPHELAMHIMGLRNQLERLHRSERDERDEQDVPAMKRMREAHRREVRWLQDRIDTLYLNHRAYHIATVCTNRPVEKPNPRAYYVGCESEVPEPF